MCGIAGLIGVKGDVRLMIQSLAHRGPDGIRVERSPGCTLAHARLSIIDLEGGWQPLHAAGGTVIGNGEIYNFVELAAEHGLADVLATGSDFEPLLHLYAREGEAAFKRLGARVSAANVAFDDHPNEKRYADRIETVTVDSVFAWLNRSGLGGAAQVVR